MRFSLFCCFCLLGLAGLPAAAQPTGNTTIAFGSCNNQSQPQPLWDDIVQAKPDLWVWLGDNIYADTDDMQLMEHSYARQLQVPGYQQLLQICPVTGIWSDHDYANDNADKNSAYKKQSQQLFLNFMGIPAQHPLRQQEGIYRSYTLGQGNHKVKILLLDGLYHRDPLTTLFGLYVPNSHADVLGEAQWQWLEQELTNSDAAVHIIATDLQVLPTSNSYTNWSAYPAARKRLLQLLARTQPAIPLLISGDRHVGELSKTEIKGYPYPLYELTSSGMTHYREAKKDGNRYRVGEQVGALNFGVLHIAWTGAGTTVTMQVRGDEGKLYLQESYTYPATHATGTFNKARRSGE
ncbi:alkaline phosphatase family protein [Pontibacter sp. Tf4]|uniref:alkaline phosphatase D family protein n=1 Tax=Pontibacter sp. Tf4 TaxID=2761620 RepID=UPI001626A030|nr:alkaline phosphatase D family protein [Pontibacter sp. Tf4]MBB6612678.1 alkaline phosphatase family protein [Pontibacter sp. Tf4]